MSLVAKKKGLLLHVCLFVCLANKQTNEENNNKLKRKLLNSCLVVRRTNFEKWTQMIAEPDL